MEGEKIDKPNRRQVVSALGAAIASALAGDSANARQSQKKDRDRKQGLSSIDREYTENTARSERDAIQRTKTYETLLRNSDILKTG